MVKSLCSLSPRNPANELTQARFVEINLKKQIELYPPIITLTDMASRRTALTPLLRSLAMATLLCWLGAMMLCSTECSDRDCSHQAGQNEMASSNSCNDSMPDSDNHSGHDDSACIALKTLIPTADNLVLFKPDFGFFTLNFVPPLEVVMVAQIESSVARQPLDAELVFTLEVSLGAAFYSLAPPVLA